MINFTFEEFLKMMKLKEIVGFAEKVRAHSPYVHREKPSLQPSNPEHV
jgi:hypothetical protein